MPEQNTNNSRYYNRTSWPEIRRQVIDRDGMTCTYCGCDVFINSEDKTVSLCIEHMYTRDETLDNLCVCCRRCNSQKNSKTFSEWQKSIERKLLKETASHEIKRYAAQLAFIKKLSETQSVVL